MRYVWNPPLRESILGPVKAGQVVELDEQAAASIRASWNREDILLGVPDAPQPVPVKKPRKRAAK